MILLLAVLSLKVVSTCFPTRGGGLPITQPSQPPSIATEQLTAPLILNSNNAITLAAPGPTTTTIAVPGACCPALTQTLTMTEFPDGLLTFTYDNDACRTMVVANCSQTDPAFDLAAALFANRMNFLDYANRSVTFPGTCNLTNQRWYMGTPPLLIDTLECILTNPPGAGGRRKR